MAAKEKSTTPAPAARKGAMKKAVASKKEIFATKALMKKHENSEGKKMEAMEKKRGEKDVVRAAIKKSMVTKSAGKNVSKSV